MQKKLENKARSEGEKLQLIETEVQIREDGRSHKERA